MWRRKKFIIGAVLVAVLLFGSLGGVVLAANNVEDSKAETKYEALLDRVCEIYEENTGITIDADELQKAYTEAQSELQAAAMEDRLAEMVENGVIDEAQAQELQEWWESKPEDMPFGSGLRGHGGFHGMSGMRGFGGSCVPIG